jgi:hypothetical protein
MSRAVLGNRHCEPFRAKQSRGENTPCWIASSGSGFGFCAIGLLPCRLRSRRNCLPPHPGKAFLSAEKMGGHGNRLLATLVMTRRGPRKGLKRNLWSGANWSGKPGRQRTGGVSRTDWLGVRGAGLTGAKTSTRSNPVP